MHKRAVLAGLWCVAGAHLAVSAADDPGTASPTTLVERFTAAAGLSAEEVRRAADTLRAIGTNAIPVLIAHLDDERPASEHFSYAVEGTVDVGYVCWRNLGHMIEYRPKAFLCNPFLTWRYVKQWWGERQTWALSDMQVEAACCSFAMSKRDGSDSVVEVCRRRIEELGVTNVDKKARMYEEMLDKVILEDVDRAHTGLRGGPSQHPPQSTNVPYIILRFRIERPEGIELESLPPADGDLKKLRGAGTTPGRK